MGYEKLQKLYPTLDPAATTGPLDYSTTAGGYVWVPAEDMWVYGWGVQHVEAVGTFTTASPVVTMSFDAANGGSPAAKGTLSPTASAIIYSEQNDVDITPFMVDASAGDSLEFTVSTAGTGGTTTGEGIPFVYAELFPAIAPA